MYGGKIAFRFKIDWASLILGRKFTVFLCFTLYLKTISKYKPPPRGGSAYIRRGDLTDIASISFLVEVWKKRYSVPKCQVIAARASVAP